MRTLGATVDGLQQALELAGVEFIDANGGGPVVRLRKRHQKKGWEHASSNTKAHGEELYDCGLNFLQRLPFRLSARFSVAFQVKPVGP
jgi:hypothetical protein